MNVLNRLLQILQTQAPAVALGLAAVALAGCLGRGAPPPGPASAPETVIKVPSEAELVQLARTDLIALWELSLKHYEQSYHDYTCLFVKQERLGDTLGAAQTIRASFLERPSCVRLQWLTGAQAADIIIYVAGSNDGQALAHPTGPLGPLLPWLRVDPAGPLVMGTSRRPITDFGFKRSLEIFLATDRQALAAGELRLEDGGTQTVEETGRPALLLIRRLPPGKGYSAALNRIWLDQQWLLPVKVEGYDWDGQLTFRYLYKDVHFNVGLKLDDFQP